MSADGAGIAKAEALERCLARLGTPESSRDAFGLLREAGVLEDGLAERLTKMVGFCNVAVHEYQRLDLGIVQAIVEGRLDDFRVFLVVLGLRG